MFLLAPIGIATERTIAEKNLRTGPALPQKNGRQWKEAYGRNARSQRPNT